MTFAEALLDLAKRPDLVAQLEDARKEDRIGILQREYPGVFEGNRGDFLLAPEGGGETGLRQIRLRIEADVAASTPKTHSITFVIITF